MDIPEPMIQNTVAQMAEEFAQRIQTQGLSIEQYFQFTGMNANVFMENLKPQALKRIQSRLVLEAVVKAEGLTASEEEVNKEINNMAEMYQMEVDKLMGLIGEEEKKAMAEDVAVQKALELVVNAAVEK
jgi:trigger factor